MNIAKECEHVTRFIIRGITGDDACLPKIEQSLSDQPFASVVQYLRSSGLNKNNQILLVADRKRIVNAVIVEGDRVIYDPRGQSVSTKGLLAPTLEIVKKIQQAELLAFMTDPKYCYENYVDYSIREQSFNEIERLVFRTIRTAVCDFNDQPIDVLFTVGSGKYSKTNGIEIANVLRTITKDFSDLCKIAREHDYHLAVYELAEQTLDYDRYILWPLCKNQRMIEHSGRGYLTSGDRLGEVLDFRNIGKEMFLHAIPAYYKEVRRYKLCELLETFKN